jgi:glutaredoxin
MNKKIELFLYIKPECNACEAFKSALDERGFAYHVIDIDTDPELKHRYGGRIPVLLANDREICEGRFDPHSLQISHFL